MSHGAILEACAVGYSLAILMELVVRKNWRRFLVEIGVLLAVLALALLINNSVNGYVSFGKGASPMVTIGVMLLATVLGIAARYVFFLKKEAFSWFDLVKPIAISPIVLLPLIGSVQATGELTQMQVLSFAFLAFQNGFFWQAVLDSSRPTTSAQAEK